MVMTTQPYAVRIVCIACRQTSEQVYADSNIHTDLQIDSDICTALCRQDCLYCLCSQMTAQLYTNTMQTGLYCIYYLCEQRSAFTDKFAFYSQTIIFFFYIRTITFAQIHAGDKIYMALCKHDCLCYLCRQMFARIYTDSKYCKDLCRCWHLGEFDTCLLMQTFVCSALYR